MNDSLLQPMQRMHSKITRFYRPTV